MPTPVIMTSIGEPAKSARISFAVVRAWMAGFAALSNWLGIPRARGLFDQLGGTLDRALHAFFTRGEVKAGTIGEHQTGGVRLDIDSGMTSNQLVALDRGHHQQARFRYFPLVGSTIVPPACSLPEASASLDHRGSARRSLESMPPGWARFGLDPDLRGRNIRAMRICGGRANGGEGSSRLFMSASCACCGLLLAFSTSGGPDRRSFRSSQDRKDPAPTLTTVAIAPTPPATTAATRTDQEGKAAREEKSPPSFDALILSRLTDDTRPRLSSGVCN